MPVIRCRNKRKHEAVSGVGDVILLFDKDCIYVKCTCKTRWKIKITIPGVKLNLNDAGYVQEEIDKFPKFEIDKSCPVYNKVYDVNMYGAKKIPVIIKEKA